MDRQALTERTLSFLLRRLHDAGVSATRRTDEHTGDAFLEVDGWRRINVENLVSELTQADPAQHEAIIERWVAFIIESGRIADQPITDADELRQRVRTRILTPDLAADPHFSYARPFPGGLALGLCLDFPNTVTTVTDQHLEKYPIGLDELYHYGQINTDGEPIDEQGPCGPFTGIGGESLFSPLRIDAPHGLFFAIPERSILLYAPADPGSITQQYLRLLDYLRIDFMRRFRANPAHTLSKDLFYCGPDGEFGTITRSDHPDVQELFTTVNLDADRLVELAVKNMNFFDGFRSRFYPTHM